MSRITIEDLNFIKYVNRQINQNSALGIELPFDSIYDIIVDAALYFWEWDDDATQEEAIGLPSNEIRRFLTTGYSATAKVPLPDWVGFITRVIPSRIKYGGHCGGNIGLFNHTANHGGGQGMDVQVSDIVVNMFEAAMYQSISYTGIRYDYNNTNHMLNITGSKHHDLTLIVERRLPYEYLYNNRLFRNYVVGQTFINMSNIISTFSFELPNGATVNYDKLEALGEKRVERVETELTSRNNTNGIIMV